jgi:N-acetyl sugar amidotransferase
MDGSDPDISFDASGVCNHCTDAIPLLQAHTLSESESHRLVEETVQRIRDQGRKKEYDCLIGISGGVDSSYLTHLAVELKLRPLLVHFDNGWNSELSVENINQIVEKSGIDLMTYVINWNEFRDLQRSFLRASVIDIEMVTDHAIVATLFRLAKEYDISHILSGDNYLTEHGMPRSWVWNKQDLTNILSIHKQFGERPLRSFPRFSTWHLYWSKFTGACKVIKFLDLVNYRKTAALKLLEDHYKWRYYGGKHYESLFTRFYQAYILPTKFGIDKRRVHLSCLIRNEEMSREKALTELERDLYGEIELKNDRAYVLKKLKFSEEEFDQIMRTPPRSHLDYPNENWVQEWMVTLSVLRNRLRQTFRPSPPDSSRP